MLCTTGSAYKFNGANKEAVAMRIFVLVETAIRVVLHTACATS